MTDEQHREIGVAMGHLSVAREFGARRVRQAAIGGEEIAKGDGNAAFVARWRRALGAQLVEQDVCGDGPVNGDGARSPRKTS